MRVVIFVPSLDTGGLASLALELASAATLRGHKVQVLTLYSSTLKRDSPVQVVNLDVPSPRYKFLKPLTALRRTFLAVLALNRFSPDSILCLDPSSAFICLVVRSLGQDFRLVVFCGTPYSLLQASDKKIIHYLYQKADLVVAPSSFLGQEIEKLNARINLRIVHNPYSTNSTYCTWPKQTDPLKPVVQFLGRLSAEKGVEITPRIAELNSDLSFRVAGDGPLMNFLLAQKDKKSLVNLELSGWGNPSDCLPTANVTILPSHIESFGIVIVESWLHGVPVVAYIRAGGPKELIDSFGGGALVEDFNNDNEWGMKIREQLEVHLTDDFLIKVLNTFSAFELIQDWLND